MCAFLRIGVCGRWTGRAGRTAGRIDELSCGQYVTDATTTTATGTITLMTDWYNVRVGMLGERVCISVLF